MSDTSGGGWIPPVEALGGNLESEKLKPYDPPHVQDAGDGDEPPVHSLSTIDYGTEALADQSEDDLADGLDSPEVNQSLCCLRELPDPWDVGEDPAAAVDASVSTLDVI